MGELASLQPLMDLFVDARTSPPASALQFPVRAVSFVLYRHTRLLAGGEIPRYQSVHVRTLDGCLRAHFAVHTSRLLSVVCQCVRPLTSAPLDELYPRLTVYHYHVAEEQGCLLKAWARRHQCYGRIRVHVPPLQLLRGRFRGCQVSVKPPIFVGQGDSCDCTLSLLAHPRFLPCVGDGGYPH